MFVFIQLDLLKMGWGRPLTFTEVLSTPKQGSPTYGPQPGTGLQALGQRAVEMAG